MDGDANGTGRTWPVDSCLLGGYLTHRARPDHLQRADAQGFVAEVAMQAGGRRQRVTEHGERKGWKQALGKQLSCIARAQV